MNLYIAAIHTLALLNGQELGFVYSIVDTVTLFNLSGVDNSRYRSVPGIVWVLTTSLSGIAYWINLLYMLVYSPPIQQVVPVHPTGAVPAGTFKPSGAIMLPPARSRWQKKNKQ